MRFLISASIFWSSAVSDVMRFLISASIFPDNSVSFAFRLVISDFAVDTSAFSVPISDFAVAISACTPSISDSAAAIRPERSVKVVSVVPALAFKFWIAFSFAVIFVVLPAILPSSSVFAVVIFSSRSVFAVVNASEVANLPSASVFVYTSAALAFKSSFSSTLSLV